MNLLAQASLFLWLPIVVVFFAVLPPKRAVIVSFVTAWLALPNVGFILPGMPNYTKMTATTIGILLCMMIFDQTRLFSLRFRWYDLAMMVWSGCPFVTALTNDMGAYEGLSATLEQLLAWGFPYVIGRVYLTDLASLRELALGFAVGGIVLMPFCLFEIRFSPVLETIVYGISHWEPERYGGYRPKVFLATGLELGMWMTNATLIAYQLWARGSVKAIRNIPLGRLTLGLLVTTILCKSTGAIGLLVFGVVILWVVTSFRKVWPIWLLLLIPPSYTFTRTFNIWSGQDAVDISRTLFGDERAQSFEFRLQNENILAQHALNRPIFGWGRFNRSNVLNSRGEKVTIVDGYWIGALGLSGMVGLVSLQAVMLLPMFLTLRRFPVSTWSDPQVGPLIGIAMLLTLTMIDFLSNAMLNPLYAVAIGGVVGQSAVRLGGRRREAEAALAFASELATEGRLVEAGIQFQRTITMASDGDDLEGRRVEAEALDGLGQTALSTGHPLDAEAAFRDALMVRDWIAAKAPEAAHFRDLAMAREGLARSLVELGRTAEAIEERKIAIQIWDILANDHPRDVGYQAHRVEALNDLAWILATDPERDLHDPGLALHLAETAVRASGEQVAPWNTLGVARYRAGDWSGAIEALERSCLSSPGGLGTGFDHFVMAMAWTRLHRLDQAREWYERGEAWTLRHRPGHPTLGRFRDEAMDLFEHDLDPPQLERK